LRIPLQATNLSTAVPTVPTKLTISGLEELIALAQECEVLLCQPNPKVCGDECLPNSKTKSLPTSRRPSRK